MRSFCLCRLKSFRRFTLAMKLTVFILTVFFLQAAASGEAQNVTVSGRDMPLKKVLATLKAQTGYVFFYDASLLKKSLPVTLDLKNVPFKAAMDDICQQQPFTWTMNHETITLVEKPQRETTLQITTFMKLKGTVTDEEGQPLVGASIVIKGTKKGTATDSKGEFTLDINPNDVLVFSMIGYVTQEVAVAGRGELLVKMTMNITNSEEVIVASTGYQTISKERATGSYDLVGSKQLDKPATNIGSRLIGQVAGMQGKLDVNGNPVFEIRGKTSLYANAQPLIVVDGFAIQGDFNSINPNDVESVTVLKDAAAASIWGARSANGVIVITTKKGRKNSPLKMDFNVFTRVGQKMDLDYVNPLASSAETVEYEKMIFNKNWTPLINSGAIYNIFYAYSIATTALTENRLGNLSTQDMNNTLENLKTISNKDQISRYLLSNPVNKQVNLNIYGGNAKMSNSLSLLYEKNQTNFKESKNSRYMINYKTTANVFKWLDFNFSGYLQMNDIHNNGVSLYDIQALSPYDLLIDKDGTYTNINQYYWPVLQQQVPVNSFPYTDWTYNPLQEIRNRDLAIKQINARLQAGLRFRIMKGLSFDSKIQYERSIIDTSNFYNDSTFYVRQIVNESSLWDWNTNEVTPNLPKGGILTQSKADVEAYNFRNQLNFDRRFGQQHEVIFIAGSEINNIRVKTNIYPTAYGYNDETLTVGNFPNGANTVSWIGENQSFGYTNSFGYKTDRYFSLYGNMAYTFRRKYTLSGSARTDASNLITDDPRYRYAPFWSVGGSWNIAREKFMQPIHWVNDLRLRLTYGYNGNVDKSTAFRPLISLGSSPDVYTGDLTATISSYGNPTLRWEKTGTWNAGTDFNLLSDKLFGKLDFYYKKGRDLIANLSIPSVNGTTSQKLNNAEMTNQGFEFTLGTKANIKGDNIVWQGSVNFSYNKNRITKLFVANYPYYNLIDGGTSAYVVGKDANTLWRFQYAGIRQSDKQPVVKGAGKDLYDFSRDAPGNAVTYMLDMGTKVAPYSLGFTSQFKIYDFDLSFIVTGKFGHVFNRMSFNYPVLWTSRVLPNSALSEVVNGDPDKIIPMPLNDNEPRFYYWNRFYSYMSYLAVSASHIRMQELNLTYHLPAAIQKKLSASGDFSIYAQGNNLFTILFNKYGEDPEFPKNGMKPQPQYTFGARFIF